MKGGEEGKRDQEMKRGESKGGKWREEAKGGRVAHKMDLSLPALVDY